MDLKNLINSYGMVLKGLALVYFFINLLLGTALIFAGVSWAMSFTFDSIQKAVEGA
jgi:hypothetical protein